MVIIWFKREKKRLKLTCGCCYEGQGQGQGQVQGEWNGIVLVVLVGMVMEAWRIQPASQPSSDDLLGLATAPGASKQPTPGSQPSTAPVCLSASLPLCLPSTLKRILSTRTKTKKKTAHSHFHILFIWKSFLQVNLPQDGN